MPVEKDIRFYDSSSFFSLSQELFEKGEQFAISSITIQELENIITRSQDSNITNFATKLLELISQNRDFCNIITHKESYEINPLVGINNDIKILSDAIYCNNNVYIDRVIFVTKYHYLRDMANTYLGDRMIELV